MARERALVHVAGPSGSGKTTLIERLLESNRSTLLMVARAERDGSLDRVKEGAKKADPELRRYAAAGASDVTRYRFPESDSDAFFCSVFMSDYSEGVLIEGDSPLDFPPDLTVYVVPPLPEGMPFLRRVSVDRSAAYAREIGRLQALVDKPGGVEEFLQALTQAEFRASLPLDAVAGARARDSMKALLKQARAKGPPEAEERWALAEGYDGVELAQVVIINVRSAAERRRGETTLPELARLREDKAIFRDVTGWRGHRIPITAVVADLQDPKDPAVRRAATRIKRAFARRS